MIHYHLNLNLPTLKRTARRVVPWTTINTFVGAVGGAVFGGVFGVFGILIHFEPSNIVSIAGYFALCGAAAGTLVGICGALLDDEESPQPESFASTTATPRNRIEAACELVSPNGGQRHNRLAPASDSPRQTRESIASRNPSLN